MPPPIIAIIPARRNSKSILFKNRRQINGLSLVEHALAFCQKLKFDQIIISTDDEYFWELPTTRIYADKRPNHLGQDNTLIAETIIELIDRRGLINEFLVLIEPTCVPKNPKHLNFLFNGEFFESGLDSFATFAKSDTKIEKIWKFENGIIKPHADVWKRRQDIEEQYCLSGHFYGFYGAMLREYWPGLCGSDVYPVFVNEPFVDINEEQDFVLAENLLGNI